MLAPVRPPPGARGILDTPSVSELVIYIKMQTSCTRRYPSVKKLCLRLGRENQTRGSSGKQHSSPEVTEDVSAALEDDLVQNLAHMSDENNRIEVLGYTFTRYLDDVFPKMQQPF
jgi:hypothetical protein